MPADNAFRWRPWGTEAFAQAQRHRQPILLAVVVPWSEACDRFLRQLSAQPELSAWLSDHFVTVHVDAERRPDIGERYATDGWPSLMALNPVGTPLAALPASLDALRAAAESLVAAFDGRFHELAVAQPSAAQPEGPLSERGHRPATSIDRLATAVDLAMAAADRVCGGFGQDVKFPLDVPLRTCLAHVVRSPGDRDLLDFVQLTLDAMAEAGIRDPDDGGVFRAAGRDWTRPEPVKLLESNAALIDIYLESSHVLGRPHDRDMALGVARYIRSHLSHPDGGFYAAQWLSDEGLRLDRTVCVDANARVVRTLLRLARATSDPSWESLAVETMERLIPATLERGGGVAHVLDTRASVRGLVADQTATAAAALDMYFVTEGTVYVDLAEELMRSVWRKYWRSEAGLGDRLVSTADAGQMGLLGQPWPAFRAGCEAAEVLDRLARMTGSQEYADWADQVWSWLESRFAQEGLDAGALPLAQLAVEGQDGGAA